MDTPITVGLVPLNSTVGDVRANTDLHIRLAKRMARRKCQIVVFPKLSLFGYPTGNLVQWLQVVEDVWPELERFAATTRRLTPTFIVGLPITSFGKVYCCAAVVRNGRVIGLVPQVSIPLVDQPYFSSGNAVDNEWVREVPMGARAINLDGTMVTIAVGEDAQSPEFWSRVGRITDIAVVQQACWHDSNSDAARREKLITISDDGSCAVVAVNAYGANDGMIFHGDCLVAANGAVFTEKGLFNRGRPVVTIFDPIADGYNLWPLTKRLTKNRELREDIERRVLGLLDYLRKSGLNGFVIAESGGRDSMLATLFAVEALNRYFSYLKPEARQKAVRKAILGIGMPTSNNTALTRTLARQFCRQLGVPYIEEPIGSIHNVNMKALRRMLGKRCDITRIARQNGQARERSLLVETLANCLGFLMINTCDGAEDFIGYATKFGDGAGDLGADEDLGKGDVEAMLRWFYRRSGGKLTAVLRCLEETKPGPELEKGQDAETDNFPYPVVDMLRTWFVIDHCSPSEMYLRAREYWGDEELRRMDPRYVSSGTLKRWVETAVLKFTANVHKLSVAPLCVAVDQTQTFDRRFFAFPISQRNVFAADLERMWNLPE